MVSLIRDMGRKVSMARNEQQKKQIDKEEEIDRLDLQPLKG